jgi:hypothetical protein
MDEDQPDKEGEQREQTFGCAKAVERFRRYAARAEKELMA